MHERSMASCALKTMLIVKTIAWTAIGGSVACPFLLSLLLWNWDAQGGPLIIPIAGLYMLLSLGPILICALVSLLRSTPLDERRLLRRGALLGGPLVILLTAWALALPSPIQRHEDLRCYRFTLPYIPQPECR